MNLTDLEIKIQNCQKCSLWKSRNKVVAGEGSLSAKILLIGEAPGKNEDLQGRPFCGDAGKFLDHLLALAKLERKDIFITSVLKCRPPQNRNPKQEELNACFPWLEKQIKILKPKLIILLGRYALKKILPEIGDISRLHGRYLQRGKDIYFISFHPAAALHQQRLKRVLEKDFKKIPEIFKKFR